MARAGGCKPLAEEYVAQVTATSGTFYLRAKTIRVRELGYRVGDFLVKGGPTTVGIELVLGPVEFGVAALANIGAVVIEIVVGPGKGALGSLEFNDVPLLRSKGVI